MVVNAIQCAHVEAKSAPMGIGLVKIMGRESGHIVLSAALAQNDVNFALIPEDPFDLEGEKGLFKALEKTPSGQETCTHTCSGRSRAGTLCRRRPEAD